MIVTFQSPASGDVIMFGDIAYKLMGLMGKDAEPKGILTVEQLPHAIARLRAAISADKAERAARDVSEEAQDAVPGGNMAITLTQRATPLLELLEWAQRKQKPVVWGV